MENLLYVFLIFILCIMYDQAMRNNEFLGSRKSRLRRKLEILKELDRLGVGYCSKESVEKNELGLKNYTWKDVLDTPLEYLEDMLKIYKKE